MFGFNHLPNKIQQNVYTFYANANSGSAEPSGSFIAWNVPETAAVLHFLVIGGGAGGGSGHFSTAGTTTSGGSGGAAGGLVTVTIPTVLLPRTLYLQVGLGGDGGAPVGTAFGNTAPTNGNPGKNGTRSFVCAFPEINNGSTLIASSTTEPGGGGGGIVGASTAGTAITVANFQNQRWRGLNGNVITPTAGGGSSAGLNGNTVTYAMLPTGGAGGAGYPATTAIRNGGSVTFASILSFITATVSAGAGSNAVSGTAGAGSNGLFCWKPFITSGGGGGGVASATGGIGGDGGAGAYGCGGGGGGAGLGASGRGGRGGDGLIIIVAG